MIQFYNFLSMANEAFKPKISFKALFLLDGTSIFDLYDIPDNQKCIYVSILNIYKGISVLTKKKGQEFILEGCKDKNVLSLAAKPSQNNMTKRQIIHEKQKSV